MIEVYVDQTERRGHYGAVLWRTIWATLGLTVLAFGYTFYTSRLLLRERRLDAKARHLSRFDALTGVANRHVFNTRLEHAIWERDKEDVAVMVIDLDGFKAVNDSLGHQTGDSLLKQVARCLDDHFRGKALLARFGGDEFAVIVERADSKTKTRQLASEAIDCIRAITSAGAHPVRISASIGLSFASDLPEGHSEPDELLKRADIALYKAKESGRDRIMAFEPGMETLLRKRNLLRSRVKQAVEAGDLVVHYQPQHDAASGALTGFEALVRIPDQQSGFLSPADFIPIAEELHLMDKLGARVLELAAEEAARWPAHLHVAVNLSAQQFETDLVQTVKTILERTHLPAQRLELEITESMFIGDTERVEAQLSQLKAQGVRIAMDDFGTGYSSLSYLWQFPFDKLKVDRSCFQRLDRSTDESERNRIAAVVETIGSMGRAMKLRVTAEGIETADQMSYAHRSGFHEVQGFFFSRPIPVDEIPAYMLRSFSEHKREQAAQTSDPTSVEPSPVSELKTTA
ncbi:bifunctional diguanylate cyclase/phosphodiesterase [Fulvimarina sp. MAC8]|uniref:putative bifunctional diguanylate cyclase/phosphodiesterase n=1 Tax=Fulvimarina sp. MAC8 TaxID=3162874 RepID=UPI0032EFC990